MNKRILFFAITFIMILNSCLINPDTEITETEVVMSLPAGSIPSGTGGFHVFILNSYVSDPENFNPQNEKIFYEKKILTGSSDVLTSAPSVYQTYELKLSNIPEGENLYMLIYYISANPDYFMLSGNSGYFYTYSPFSVSRGKTTAINLTSSINWQRIVLINDTGQTWYSRDSYNWYGPFETGLNQSRSIAYAKGRFIAAGQINGTNYGISESFDGITWNTLSLGGTGAVLTGLASNPAGHFLASGTNGGYSQVFKSLDGKVWTGPHAVSYPAINPAWDENKWYITTTSGYPFYSSPDGITWTDTGGSANLYQVNTLIGINGRIIVGGGAAGNTNKQTRTSSTQGASFGGATNVNKATDYIFAFAADPASGRLLAAGSGITAQINYSDNYGAADSWTASSGVGSGSFRAAAHWKYGFLTGNDSGDLYASADGIIFELRYNFGPFTKIRGIAYNGVP